MGCWEKRLVGWDRDELRCPGLSCSCVLEKGGGGDRLSGYVPGGTGRLADLRWWRTWVVGGNILRFCRSFEGGHCSSCDHIRDVESAGDLRRRDGTLVFTHEFSAIVRRRVPYLSCRSLSPLLRPFTVAGDVAQPHARARTHLVSLFLCLGSRSCRILVYGG